MNKRWFLWICLFPLALSAQNAFTATEVKEIMKRVADWQIERYDKGKRHPDLNWTNGALFVGMIDWAELAERTDKDSKYYEWLRRIGRRNFWQVDKKMYHADDIAVAQTFIDLYRKYSDKNMIIPTLARTNWVVGNPSKGSFLLNPSDLSTLERWTWCDALFMAPPVYAKLYVNTGNKKYIDFMNKEYKATYDFLFSKKDSLFYRDHRYFDKRESNGANVFWGRGNGWVVAGLCEILKELPPKDKNRAFYQQLFTILATRLGHLQSPDGYWHASMLDPSSYPSPETSATGFIVYGLAYGINEGLLDKATFLPIVKRGWQAMVDAVDDDGKLGFVQPIGEDPRKVTREMTEVYGVGAMLAAGCEIYKLLENQ